MTGYYNQPEEERQGLHPDGFMRTGDIGIMDAQGYTRIIDRKKDMILVSGFNVFPNELEQVISLCPGVVECAAIGVPTKTGRGHQVFIIKNDPALTEDDVAAFCHENLTGYKRPKYIEFRDDLPKTNVGKILRRELRNPPRDGGGATRPTRFWRPLAARLCGTLKPLPLPCLPPP